MRIRAATEGAVKGVLAWRYSGRGVGDYERFIGSCLESEVRSHLLVILKERRTTNRG